MLKRVAIILLYCFYALVLTLLLLVIRFPQEAFLNWTAGLLEREMGGYRCDIDDVAYTHPFGLKFDRILLNREGDPQEVSLDDVVVRLNPRQPLQEFELSFGLYGGTVRTGVRLLENGEVVECPDLSVAGIDIVAVGPLQSRLERPVSGIFSFDGTFLGSRGDLANGEFSGETKIGDFYFVLRRPILQSRDVAFTEVKATSRLQNGLLTLQDGQAAGDSYDGSFAGTVRFRKPWQESELEISGDLVVKDEYLRDNRQAARAVALLNHKYGGEALPYHVDGSLREPEFTFGAQN